MICESYSRRVVDSGARVTVTIEISAGEIDRERVLRMLSENRVLEVIRKGLDCVYKEEEE